MYSNRMMGGRSGFGIFFIFLIVGLYFLNASLKFFPIPEALASNVLYNKILFLLAGILILIGGLRFLFPRRAFY